MTMNKRELSGIPLSLFISIASLYSLTSGVYNIFVSYIAIFYLVIDAFLIIVERIKNIASDIYIDLLLHHLFSILGIYQITKNKSHFAFESSLIGLLDITTFFLLTNRYLKDTKYKFVTSKLLSISWIPIRIILLPYVMYSLITHHDITKLNVEFLSILIVQSLNIKWTFEAFKFRFNTNFSALLLLMPSIVFNQGSYLFASNIVLYFSSFTHHSMKTKLSIALDSAAISVYCILLCCKLNILQCLVIYLIMFTQKYYICKSEMHSIIFMICSLYLCDYSLVNTTIFAFIIMSFYNFQKRRESLPWHFSCSLLMMKCFINSRIKNNTLK